MNPNSYYSSFESPSLDIDTDPIVKNPLKLKSSRTKSENTVHVKKESTAIYLGKVVDI